MKLLHVKQINVGLLSVVLMCLLASCTKTTLGRRINKNYIQDIIKGRTTKEEVTRKFGTPYRSHNLGDREILTYKYLTEDGVYQELVITIENDVVSTFSQK